MVDILEGTLIFIVEYLMHDQWHVSCQQTPEILFSHHEEMRLV